MGERCSIIKIAAASVGEGVWPKYSAAKEYIFEPDPETVERIARSLSRRPEQPADEPEAAANEL